jgi:hypothetical protein
MNVCHTYKLEHLLDLLFLQFHRSLLLSFLGVVGDTYTHTKNDRSSRACDRPAERGLAGASSSSHSRRGGPRYKWRGREGSS